MDRQTDLDLLGRVIDAATDDNVIAEAQRLGEQVVGGRYLTSAEQAWAFGWAGSAGSKENPMLVISGVTLAVSDIAAALGVPVPTGSRYDKREALARPLITAWRASESEAQECADSAWWWGDSRRHVEACRAAERSAALRSANLKQLWRAIRAAAFA